jgi:hypothetical protein
MKNHIGIILIGLIAISYLAIRPHEAEAGTIFPCGQEGDFCCLFGDKCAEGLACIDFICEPAPNSCDEFSGTLGTLCDAFCGKLECESDIPQTQFLRRLLCNFIEKSFMAKNGTEPPCDPCAELAAIAECPCDYDLVPKDPTCWGSCNGCTLPPKFIPCSNTGCITDGFDNCVLDAGHSGFARGLRDESDDNVLSCEVIFLDPITSCNAEHQFHDGITQSEFETCLCRLAQYANELHPIVNVTDTGPPFSCEPSPP